MKLLTCAYLVLMVALISEIMQSPVWPWAFAGAEALMVYWWVRLYREEQREND